MTVAMLLLLGAAGGSLRSLIELYNSSMEWRAARRVHRRAVRAGETLPRPAYQDFVDPVPDVVAAVFHTGLGAAATALLGASGHINSVYAALAVGISGPALLAQLGQIQGVRDAVTGAESMPADRPAALGRPAPTAHAQPATSPAHHHGEPGETPQGAG